MTHKEKMLMSILTMLLGLVCMFVALLQVKEYITLGDHLMILFGCAIVIIGALMLPKS
jgi:hypothetical protein